MVYKGDFMFKRNLNIIFSLILITFSFYYTNKIVTISRQNDPIMLEIMKYSESVKDTKVEALLENNNIIPGIKGEKIDIEKSYSNMKKVGKFDKSLISFEETKPVISLENNYENYIISGNKTKNNVSIVVELSDTSYVEELLTILNKKNVQATFFIDKELYDSSIDLIKLIKSFGNDVELSSQNYSIYEVNKYNSIIKLISDDRLEFCINKDRDNDLLNNCISSKLYTIIPSFEASNYLYNSVKHNLENGSIILIKNNKPILNELSATINYIHQKGKKIVLLKNLILE